MSRDRTWSQIRDEALAEDPEAGAVYEELEQRMAFVRPVILERQRRGWSQRRLAEEAGMKQPQVARFEAAETDPRVSTVVRLHRALDLDPRTGRRVRGSRAGVSPDLVGTGKPLTKRRPRART